MKNGVAIYGGFAGTESVLSAAGSFGPRHDPFGRDRRRRRRGQQLSRRHIRRLGDRDGRPRRLHDHGRPRGRRRAGQQGGRHLRRGRQPHARQPRDHGQLRRRSRRRHARRTRAARRSRAARSRRTRPTAAAGSAEAVSRPAAWARSRWIAASFAATRRATRRAPARFRRPTTRSSRTRSSSATRRNGVYFAQQGNKLVNCTIVGNWQLHRDVRGRQQRDCELDRRGRRARGDQPVLQRRRVSASRTSPEATPGRGTSTRIRTSSTRRRATIGWARPRPRWTPAATPRRPDSSPTSEACRASSTIRGEPDTGQGSAPVVDMGAFERVPLSVSAPASPSVCAGTIAELSVVAAGHATRSRTAGARAAWISTTRRPSRAPRPTRSRSILPAWATPAPTTWSSRTDLARFGSRRPASSRCTGCRARPRSRLRSRFRSVRPASPRASRATPARPTPGPCPEARSRRARARTRSHSPPGAAGTVMSLSVVETGAGSCASPQSVREGPRRLHRRADVLPVSRRDHRDRARRHHDRLRGRKVLSGRSRHPGRDGGLHSPGRARRAPTSPPPRRATCSPTSRRTPSSRSGWSSSAARSISTGCGAGDPAAVLPDGRR